MNELDHLIQLLEIHDIQIVKGIVVDTETFDELMLIGAPLTTNNKRSAVYYNGYKIVSKG